LLESINIKKVNVEELDEDFTEIGEDANEFSPVGTSRCIGLENSTIKPPRPSPIESKLLFRT
jgi:hypothetical protein